MSTIGTVTDRASTVPTQVEAGGRAGDRGHVETSACLVRCAAAALASCGIPASTRRAPLARMWRTPIGLATMLQHARYPPSRGVNTMWLRGEMIVRSYLQRQGRRACTSACAGSGSVRQRAAATTLAPAPPQHGSSRAAHLEVSMSRARRAPPHPVPRITRRCLHTGRHQGVAASSRSSGRHEQVRRQACATPGSPRRLTVQWSGGWARLRHMSQEHALVRAASAVRQVGQQRRRQRHTCLPS